MVHKEDLIDFLDTNHKGRFFNVKFRKKSTGELRSMTCKLGVKYKRKTDRQLNYNPRDRGILPVYDANKREFRSFDINTVESITVNKEVHKVK